MRFLSETGSRCWPRPWPISTSRAFMCHRSFGRASKTHASRTLARGRYFHRHGQCCRLEETMDPQPKAKILVVDDSSTVLIMEELLLRRKYEVIKATGGMQALRLAAEQRPELILLDIVMPDMDGLETCRLLRGMEATKVTPIIMVTTRGEQKTMAAAYA